MIKNTNNGAYSFEGVPTHARVKLYFIFMITNTNNGAHCIAGVPTQEWGSIRFLPLFNHSSLAMVQFPIISLFPLWGLSNYALLNIGPLSFIDRVQLKTPKKTSDKLPYIFT